MESFLYWKQLRVGTTKTAQPNCNGQTLSKMLIPLPPLAEQQRIVARVDELMARIDDLEKTETELEKLKSAFPGDMKAALLQAAMQGKLTEQLPEDGDAADLLEQIAKEKSQLIKEGKIKKEKPLPEITPDEVPFDIPENWKWVRLGNFIRLINGRAYKKQELLNTGKYKVLRVGNFFTNESWYYSDLELEDDKYCYSGDLLYAWSASFGPMIWNGDKTIFHYHIWNVKFDDRVFYRNYLYWFLIADKTNIKKHTTGSTMIHISMINMLPRLIPVPPLAEQKRIVEKLDKLLPLCDGLIEE